MKRTIAAVAMVLPMAAGAELDLAMPDTVGDWAAERMCQRYGDVAKGAMIGVETGVPEHLTMQALDRELGDQPAEAYETMQQIVRSAYAERPPYTPQEARVGVVSYCRAVNDIE